MAPPPQTPTQNEQAGLNRRLGKIAAEMSALARLIQTSHEETRILASNQVHTRLTRIESSIQDLRELHIRSI